MPPDTALRTIQTPGVVSMSGRPGRGSAALGRAARDRAGNLAEPFPAAANHNANPLATALSDTARPDILGYAVVKGGKTF